MSSDDKVLAKRKDPPVDQNTAIEPTPLDESALPKKPTIRPSISRGVGVVHKPRVGAQFQVANLPDVQPKKVASNQSDITSMKKQASE